MQQVILNGQAFNDLPFNKQAVKDAYLLKSDLY
jgi:hypothetical protein